MATNLAICARIIYNQEILGLTKEIRKFKEKFAWEKFICPNFTNDFDSRSFGQNKYKYEIPPLQRILDILNFNIIQCNCEDCCQTYSKQINNYPSSIIDEYEYGIIEYLIEMGSMNHLNERFISHELCYLYKYINEKSKNFKLIDMYLADFRPEKQITMLGRLRGWLYTYKTKPYSEQIELFKFVYELNKIAYSYEEQQEDYLFFYDWFSIEEVGSLLP